MSNRKKLPKDKPTTDYTIADLIEDESQKWGEYVQMVQIQAAVRGKHGVMVIGTEKVFECEHVPLGKILHAKDQAAYDRFVASKEK